ncbi:MAG TPA: trehalase family glycosidase [Candidatus Xenobia bacterium]|jgi:alpha,alpha-trehalase
MRSVLLILACVVGVGLAAPPATDIRAYIKAAWHDLTRSVVSPAAYHDPRFETRPVLYLPADLPTPAPVVKLQEAGVEVRPLPRPILHLGDVQPTELAQQGLLYLPFPYVVPGGKFNEMYGWDSYFIMRGLVADGQAALADGMLENQLFEIEHYGAVLNANRSYYLTRSQPPFLTQAIRLLYPRHAKDPLWLSRVYDLAVREHHFWTTAPNLAGQTGLSRYYDVGEGPVPEMRPGVAYYEKVATWALTHPGQTDYAHFLAAGERDLTGRVMAFTVQGPALASGDPQELALTPDYYHGDRAMRASGFDVTFRFGPFSGATHHYAPVCLNSLLYKTETDLAWMAATLGKVDQSARWLRTAEARKEAVDRWLWHQDVGMYFDYDVVAHKPSSYRYATTFYPLWAGLSSPQQTALVVRHLRDFEQAHGLAMSDVETGAQWDKPFGWAPVHLLTVEGLAAHGFTSDAARLATEFTDTVRANFERERTIREKYDVVKGTTDTPIGVGYTENVMGFGWTNAAYLELLKYRISP